MRHRYEPRPGICISSLAYEYPAAWQIPEHSHAADQLIYAISGVMEIRIAQTLGSGGCSGLSSSEHLHRDVLASIWHDAAGMDRAQLPDIAGNLKNHISARGWFTFAHAPGEALATAPSPVDQPSPKLFCMDTKSVLSCAKACS